MEISFHFFHQKFLRKVIPKYYEKAFTLKAKEKKKIAVFRSHFVIGVVLKKAFAKTCFDQRKMIESFTDVRASHPM